MRVSRMRVGDSETNSAAAAAAAAVCVGRKGAVTTAPSNALDSSTPAISDLIRRCVGSPIHAIQVPHRSVGVEYGGSRVRRSQRIGTWIASLFWVTTKE